MYLALHVCEISACPDYRLRLHPTWPGPNMGCPIFEVCIGDAAFSCFPMAELICVELKCFGNSVFIQCGLARYRKNSICPLNRSFCRSIDCPIQDTDYEQRTYQLSMWWNRQISAQQAGFSDFRLSEANVSNKFRVATSNSPKSFPIDQQHPLQTHRQLRHVNHSMLQVSVHCLQFQNKAYRILDILEPIRRKS